MDEEPEGELRWSRTQMEKYLWRQLVALPLAMSSAGRLRYLLEPEGAQRPRSPAELLRLQVQ